eukprot:GHVP01021314.1.p1 GENE.GHVP01021314.1~~GHVP01021314.1.p1  ORF type:complete len:350 (-),score=56.02 GHVP01021314.1:126-1175(-)
MELPWVEKYRPNTLDEIVSHTDPIATIKKFVENGQLPHLLLHGPPGTGKTSTVQALGTLLHGQQKAQMILELNASDDRGINVVRDTIKAFSESKTTLSVGKKVDADNQENPENSSQGEPEAPNVKLVVLDEADHMTGAAQDALRRTMEVYSSNVRFVLVCNYVNKVKPAIQSRCTKFRLSPLSQEDMKFRAETVQKHENVLMEKEAMEALVTHAQGDMRRVINTMQSCWLSKAPEIITRDDVHRALGIPLVEEVEAIFYSLTNHTFDEALATVQKVMQKKGYSVTEILNAIYKKASKLDWPITCALTLFPRLADIEYRTGSGADEFIQASCLVAAFIEIRKELRNIVEP